MKKQAVIGIGTIKNALNRCVKQAKSMPTGFGEHD
jgi:hypothetical protein